MKKSNFRSLPNFETQTDCASCGSINVETRVVDTTFPFTSGRETVELPVRIPVYKCNDCDIEFTGPDADELCHDKVCEYLNVMTPSQIRTIRSRLNLSVPEFSKRTGIGSASINRWEKGALIQNKAMDNLLFLLSIEGNLDLLEAKKNRPSDVQLKKKFEFLSTTIFKLHARHEFRFH